MRQPFSKASVVSRCDGFIDAEIDNEIVVLNIESGACYAFNRVGSRVWSLIATPANIGDICAKLQTEYKVEPGVCERQVLDLLEELRAQGLVTLEQ